MATQSNGEYECLYFFGGKGTAGYLKDGFSYDPRRNKWKPMEAMPRASFCIRRCRWGKRMCWLFSGSDGHDADKAIELGDNYHMPNNVLAYHTITTTPGRNSATMPAGVAGAAAVRWNNRLLLVGGELRPGVRTGAIQMATLQTVRQKSQFGWIDYTTLVVYLAGLGFISYYFSEEKTNLGGLPAGEQKYSLLGRGYQHHGHTGERHRVYETPARKRMP